MSNGWVYNIILFAEIIKFSLPISNYFSRLVKFFICLSYTLIILLNYSIN